MKIENYCTLEFPSRSANEGFARAAADRNTRLNSSHEIPSRMPSSA